MRSIVYFFPDTNNEGKSNTVDGDLKASKENIDDKGVEWYEVVQNKNEEKIGQAAEERKLDGGENFAAFEPLFYLSNIRKIKYRLAGGSHEVEKSEEGIE